MLGVVASMLAVVCKRMQPTPNNVRTKEMLGVVGSNVWPVSDFEQRLPRTRNNMQQGVQTDATCNIQQCWELLAKNAALDCTGLYSKTCGEENRSFWLKYFSDYRWLERNKSILCRASFVKELKYILNPRVARIRREEIVGNFLI